MICFFSIFFFQFIVAEVKGSVPEEYAFRIFNLSHLYTLYLFATQWFSTLVLEDPYAYRFFCLVIPLNNVMFNLSLKWLSTYGIMLQLPGFKCNDVQMNRNRIVPGYSQTSTKEHLFVSTKCISLSQCLTLGLYSQSLRVGVLIYSSISFRLYRKRALI